MNDETRRERIVLETERHRIVGDVTLPAEGYRSRVSDLLNREGFQFVPLSNAVITGINGSKERDGDGVHRRRARSHPDRLRRDPRRLT